MKRESINLKNSCLLFCVSVIFVTFLNITCDKDKSVNSNNDQLIAGPFEEVEMTINNFHFILNSRGKLKEGILSEILPNDKLDVLGVLYNAGLWLGVLTIEGSCVNVVGVGLYGYSNYSTVWGENQKGVFFVNEQILTSLSSYEKNTLLDYGFPVNSQNNLINYGDAMCWSVLKPEIVDFGIETDPIENIALTQAVYGYEREDLKNIVFIRYTIKSQNNISYSEMYSGFFADMDLAGFSCELGCENSTGYDLDRDLSYTYVPGDTAETYVVGIKYLESPLDDQGSVPASSHRILRKGSYHEPDSSISDYSEADLRSAEEILYALQGLSNKGEPMIDPITGKETLYAFTGDPVLGTGWLDVEVDVRSLLNYGPFTLSANEDKVITIALVVESGENLGVAIESLKNKVDALSNEPSLWQF